MPVELLYRDTIATQGMGGALGEPSPPLHGARISSIHTGTSQLVSFWMRSSAWLSGAAACDQRLGRWRRGDVPRTLLGPVQPFIATALVSAAFFVFSHRCIAS